MKYLILAAFVFISGCMTVNVTTGCNSEITVSLDKPVSVVPSVTASGNTVPLVP